MDVKLALRELKASIEGPGFQCHIETYREAISALEKQIPEKPGTNGTDEQDYYICPNCNTPLYSIGDTVYWDMRPKHCEECGQALDWSDYEC